MVKHQLGPSVRRRVLAEERPGVGRDVVAVEVALQGLAVPDAGVQVAAQRVDLPPLRVDTHLVAGAGTRAVLIGGQQTGLQSCHLLVGLCSRAGPHLFFCVPGDAGPLVLLDAVSPEISQILSAIPTPKQVHCLCRTHTHTHTTLLLHHYRRHQRSGHLTLRQLKLSYINK